MQDEVPEGLKNGSGEESDSTHTSAENKYSEEAQLNSDCSAKDATEVKLSEIDKTIR